MRVLQYQQRLQVSNHDLCTIHVSIQVVPDNREQVRVSAVEPLKFPPKLGNLRTL